MIQPGVYPAAVTPLDAKSRLDPEGLAKLLAWFESAGCQGAVLAGTNGEGPSLSATEKRELIELGSKLKGKLDLILGIATPSLEEAAWLCRRAADSGAVAVLVMPPSYFKEAAEDALIAWFEQLFERSPLPVLAYNFPQRTGITLTAGFMERLGRHSNMAGLKDSSGNPDNVHSYRKALPEGKVLFTGDETLLLDCLQNGWSGSISGAANSVPHWLSQIIAEWLSGDQVSAQEKFKILLPVLQAIRRNLQPAGHKAVLHAYGVLPTLHVRLPLTDCAAEVRDELLAEIKKATGG